MTKKNAPTAPNGPKTRIVRILGAFSDAIPERRDLDTAQREAYETDARTAKLLAHVGVSGINNLWDGGNARGVIVVRGTIPLMRV